jgi:hypothetical protein
MDSRRRRPGVRVLRVRVGSDDLGSAGFRPLAGAFSGVATSAASAGASAAVFRAADEPEPRPERLRRRVVVDGVPAAGSISTSSPGFDSASSAWTTSPSCAPFSSPGWAGRLERPRPPRRRGRLRFAEGAAPSPSCGPSPSRTSTAAPWALASAPDRLAAGCVSVTFSATPSRAPPWRDRDATPEDPPELGGRRWRRAAAGRASPLGAGASSAEAWGGAESESGASALPAADRASGSGPDPSPDAGLGPGRLRPLPPRRRRRLAGAGVV